MCWSGWTRPEIEGRWSRVARVCVDASLVLERLLSQEHVLQADRLWGQWAKARMIMVAPPLIYAEVPSALREKVYDGLLSPQAGERTFEAFCVLGIVPISRGDLHLRAWDLGKLLNIRRLYDLQYVALAQLERCEFWTADQRLVNLVSRHFPWVHWVGEVKV